MSLTSPPRFVNVEEELAIGDAGRSICCSTSQGQNPHWIRLPKDGSCLHNIRSFVIQYSSRFQTQVIFSMTVALAQPGLVVLSCRLILVFGYASGSSIDKPPCTENTIGRTARHMGMLQWRSRALICC